jgi:hypothetical protein
VALQPPSGSYKVEEPEDLEMIKKPSYLASKKISEEESK